MPAGASALQMLGGKEHLSFPVSAFFPSLPSRCPLSLLDAHRSLRAELRELSWMLHVRLFYSVTQMLVGATGRLFSFSFFPLPKDDLQQKLEAVNLNGRRGALSQSISLVSEGAIRLVAVRLAPFIHQRAAPRSGAVTSPQGRTEDGGLF